MCGPTDGERDPYKVLGVSSSATPEHIRRVYKALCLKWHPDKHPPGQPKLTAETNFKSISVAYATLTERHHRSSRFTKSYSSNSTSANTTSTHTAGAAKKQTPFFQPTSFRTDDSAFYFHDDVFDDADDEFGYADNEEHDDEPSHSSNAAPAPDVVYDLPLSLCEYANGCIKHHRLQSNAAAANNNKLLRIVVKPWYRPGDRIRFRNVVAPDTDVVFKLTLFKHETFSATPKIQGDDVLATVKIALVDALTGCKLSIETGKGVKTINVSAVVTPGMKRIVPNCGLRCKDGGGFGDVVVRFDVVFPKRVDEGSRLGLREVFMKVEQGGVGMRRSSSVFSARAFRKQDGLRDACGHCGFGGGGGEQGGEEAESFRGDTSRATRDGAEEGSGSEGESGRARARARATKARGQQKRLRSMFAKSSCKLASVFR